MRRTGCVDVAMAVCRAQRRPPISPAMAARKLAGVFGVLAAGSGGLAYYDYTTQHKMRRLGRWDPAQALVRYRNAANSLVRAELTVDELRAYDGADGKPLYFAAAGRIYDVTNRDFFLEAYGSYAGRDASVCLARLSLQRRDVGRLDWDCLTSKDVAVLEDWVRYFDERYVCMGHLREWREWEAARGKAAA